MENYKCLDVLVNCAGIGVARKTYSIQKNLPHPLDEFERVLKVGLHRMKNFKISIQFTQPNLAINNLQIELGVMGTMMRCLF